MAKKDRVKLRFSMNRLQRLCASLNDEQKDIVRSNGFGSFLELSVFRVPIPLLEWVMTHLHLGNKEFKYGYKRIKFCKAMVDQVFGFSSGDIQVSLDNVSAELMEEATSLHVNYVIGQNKPSISEAITLCLKELNEDAFMRHFMLVALSTFIYPNTLNSIDLHLLNYVLRAGQIKNYDWASFVFDYLTEEVKRFQKTIRSSDAYIREGAHWYGSCLPLLAVIYMDFLDLNIGFGNAHMICYDLPRFCHVKTEDFSSVLDADCVPHSSSDHMEFGNVDFRDFSSTPYHVVLKNIGASANFNDNDDDVINNAPNNPIIEGGRSSGGGSLPYVPAFDVPACIEPIVREHYVKLVPQVSSILYSSQSSASSVQDSLLALFSKSFGSLSSDVFKIGSSSVASSLVIESNG